MAIIYALAFDRRNARRWIAFAIMSRGACFGTLRPREVFALDSATVDRPLEGVMRWSPWSGAVPSLRLVHSCHVAEDGVLAHPYEVGVAGSRGE